MSENAAVRIVNSAVYAVQLLQSEMRGEAKRAELTSDEDVAALIQDLRREAASPCSARNNFDLL